VQKAELALLQQQAAERDTEVHKQAMADLVEAQDEEEKAKAVRRRRAEAIRRDTEVELARKREAKAIAEEREFAEGQLIQAAARQHLQAEKIKAKTARDRRLATAREVMEHNRSAQLQREEQASAEGDMDSHFAMQAAAAAIEDQDRLHRAAQVKSAANKRFYEEKAAFEQKSARQAVVENSQDRVYQERLELAARARGLAKREQRDRARADAHTFNRAVVLGKRTSEAEEAAAELTWQRAAEEAAVLAHEEELRKQAHRKDERREYVQCLSKQKIAAAEKRDVMALGPYREREQLTIRAQAQRNVEDRLRAAALKKLHSIGAHPSFVRAAEAQQ
jgi:hypothetical protein